MKPMLAKKYADHKSTLPSRFFVQPKLNGVRMLHCNGISQSRDEHIWHSSVLKHISDELAHFTQAKPTYIYDGELYCHGLSLQQINSRVAVTRKEPHPGALQISYHIFDLIDPLNPELPFSARSDILSSFSDRLRYGNAKYLSIVPTSFVFANQAEHLYTSYRSSGYEGLMYRTDSPYGLEHLCTNKENRWTCLLKRKDWQDDEFTITDFTRTTGDKGNIGFQLTCITPSGILFNVGSGLEHTMIQEYDSCPPIGQKARVRYEVLSDGGVPLKPTLEAIL